MTSPKEDMSRLARLMPGLMLVQLVLLPAGVALASAAATVVVLVVPLLAGPVVFRRRSFARTTAASMAAWLVGLATTAVFVVLTRVVQSDAALLGIPVVLLVWMLAFGGRAFAAERRRGPRLRLVLLWASVVPAAYLCGRVVYDLSFKAGNAGMDVLGLLLVPVMAGGCTLGLRAALFVEARLAEGEAVGEAA